ncbi:MAG: S9 family peptidase [Gemmatimonadales bacterium]|nr:MAG: S9 family peptidase [Gemmatimonadales bacterium]
MPRTALLPSLRRIFPVVLAVLLPAGLVAQEVRPLTLAEYGEWNRVTEVTLSPDGAWMTYAYSPNEGDDRFFVRQLDGTTSHEAVNGGDALFSSDGHWVAFLTSPPEEEAEKLRQDRQPVPRTLHVRELGSGAEETYPGVRSARFSEDGRWLAIHRDRSDREADHRGSDLLLRDLVSGTVLNLGNVSEFAFNEPSSHLAYLVDAAEHAGNGLYLMTLADARIQSIRSAEERFEDLSWSEAGDRLAVLAGSEEEGAAHRVNHLVLATGIGAGSVETRAVAPGESSGFPEGFVLSELTGPSFTEDGARLLLGIKDQEEEWEADDDGPNVDVWHWKDDELQSRQMITANGDRRSTYATVYNVDEGTFVRLATEAMPRVELTEDGRWAVGFRDEPYRWDYDAQGGRADLVRIDPGTGSQEVFATGVRRAMGTSPDGRWALYAQDEVLYSVNLNTLETVNLTAATGVDYIDREFDLVAERPAYGVGGWTEDGRVLLYTRYDVHAVPLAGGVPQDVTGGAGAREEVRYRVVRLDREADFVDPRGVLLSAYGEWTKRSGYARARPGSDPAPLLFDEEMIGSVRKADDADRVVFTRQTFRQFPDWWLADTDFEAPHRITDANPQIAEFAWGDRVLIDYVDQRGNRLQGTLTLPAGYQAGERYPMVVYFYEKMSQRHHQFSPPVYDDRPHASTYASNGYLFFMPDIVYDDGLPGISALDDITSAVQAVIDQGYADPDRIGLQGHSWGGYQSSFIVTQTDMFAAVVTGAPLTNLMSMYNILYKRTGNGNGPILEWSQGRFGVTPWDDFDLYVRQSPVHHADKITTPFMILHGTADGAVDWNQGLEFFTAARRLGKEVILLSYPDEPHHLQEEANQKDFQTRMWEYFDHHLRGADAPAWMTDGVPHLEKGKPPAPKVVS